MELGLHPYELTLPRLPLERPYLKYGHILKVPCIRIPTYEYGEDTIQTHNTICWSVDDTGIFTKNHIFIDEKEQKFVDDTCRSTLTVNCHLNNRSGFLSCPFIRMNLTLHF